MTSLAPHGGCNWGSCAQCFPNNTPASTTDQMLRTIIEFNFKMMNSAHAVMEACTDKNSRQFQEAYQIYRDCSRAYDDAVRAHRYGFPGL